MPSHLTRMEIEKVSLVDAGANDRRFAILKRAGGGGGVRKHSGADHTHDHDHEEEEPVAPKAKPAAAPAVVPPIGQLISGLRNALWAVMTAPDAAVAKRARFSRTFADFEAEVMSVVAKHPARLTAKQMAQLRDARKTINEVLGSEPEADVEKGDEDVDEQELRGIIADEIAKALKGVAKAEPADDDMEAEPTSTDLAKAVIAISDRLERLEKSRSQSLPGSDAGEVRKRSSLAGILN